MTDNTDTYPPYDIAFALKRIPRLADYRVNRWISRGSQDLWANMMIESMQVLRDAGLPPDVYSRTESIARDALLDLDIDLDGHLYNDDEGYLFYVDRPVFSIGDRVMVEGVPGMSAYGEVIRIGEFDPYLDDRRYLVLNDHGIEHWWNGKSLDLRRGRVVQ